ncbi:uncharacterized protein LOC121052123 isoform X2 [Rosa chinensis]|uniref:uncharacterized protein LOC121052123 isoform X2 n=1 Tax=Rosa chinensis TaxID=74649 RepID=UPI001AD8AF70|nr:uncharacterized protein LOC121052123 isoform X2 [Rosa chinensis]
MSELLTSLLSKTDTLTATVPVTVPGMKVIAEQCGYYICLSAMSDLRMKSLGLLANLSCLYTGNDDSRSCIELKGFWTSQGQDDPHLLRYRGWSSLVRQLSILSNYVYIVDENRTRLLVLLILKLDAFRMASDYQSLKIFWLITWADDGAESRASLPSVWTLLELLGRGWGK